jgi:hypothetical protein
MQRSVKHLTFLCVQCRTARSSDRVLCRTQAIDRPYPHPQTYIPPQYTHISTSAINTTALACLLGALLSLDILLASTNGLKIPLASCTPSFANFQVAISDLALNTA